MRFDTRMAAGDFTKTAPFPSLPSNRLPQPDPWTFRPDIGPSNIKAKLPENHSNILLSGRNALLMI
jgi:hypothetical protein